MGTNRTKWDFRFLDLAKHISNWSKDPSTKVGAIVAKDNIVLGLGYNGFPKGVIDDPERYNNRDDKYKYIVHAEVNALIMAGHNAKNASLYVYPSFAVPNICNECCKFAIQFGIKEIVSFKSVPTLDLVKRWEESIKISKQMCQEAGVICREI